MPTVDKLTSQEVMPTKLGLPDANGYSDVHSTPGIHPAQQSRSKANFAALISAGQRELNDKSLSGMRIEDVVLLAGTSVGAFYSRFKNKEAFFSAIQAITVAEVFQILETEIARVASISDDESMIDGLADTWVHVYRKHNPVYIASARHVAVNREAWKPFQKLGHAAAALVLEQIGPRLKASGVQDIERVVPAALQVVNGALLNSVLNNPGPVSIEDPQMAKNMAKVLKCFLLVK